MTWLHDGRKLQLFRSMQILLVLVLGIGLFTRNVSVVVNATVGFLVTFLPAYFERDHQITLGPGITLWITAAVFLHAVGALGPYRTLWWWDHITHTLSASIVAGVGYAVVRAVDEHDDNIRLPSRFMFLFILLFVMAFGVFWEIIEFLIDEATDIFGITSVLTQYGLEDTLIDLVFDMIGAVIFATLGTERVQHVVDILQTRFDDLEQTAETVIHDE